MLAKLFEKIQESAATATITLNGRTYTSKEVVPVREPSPVPLDVSNLSSLVEYVARVAERDGQPAARLVVHVSSPRSAEVVSEIAGDFCQRRTYLKAAESFYWKGGGQPMPIEQFIIMLQSQFSPSDGVTKILKLVGNIEDSAVKRYCDDGVTQQVTAIAGVVRREDVPVPPRVELAPFRSFVETPQAVSPFVLRMQPAKDGPPLVALYEADGGSWRNVAMSYVRDYLVQRLPAGVVVLA